LSRTESYYYIVNELYSFQLKKFTTRFLKIIWRKALLLSIFYFLDFPMNVLAALKEEVFVRCCYLLLAHVLSFSLSQFEFFPQKMNEWLRRPDDDERTTSNSNRKQNFVKNISWKKRRISGKSLILNRNFSFTSLRFLLSSDFD
jgi:hypothetical protein